LLDSETVISGVVASTCWQLFGKLVHHSALSASSVGFTRQVFDQVLAHEFGNITVMAYETRQQFSPIADTKPGHLVRSRFTVELQKATRVLQPEGKVFLKANSRRVSKKFAWLVIQALKQERRKLSTSYFCPRFL
jgi:hypothetical protein